MASFVNRAEVRVVRTSRGGTHAIIDWILAQAPGRTCLLNRAGRLSRKDLLVHSYEDVFLGSFRTRGRSPEVPRHRRAAALREP